MTFETVPTETPAARATSLIPTDWDIRQEPPEGRGTAGRPSHYRQHRTRHRRSYGQCEVGDVERRGGRTAPLLLVHERQDAVRPQPRLVDHDLAEGVQLTPVVQQRPVRVSGGLRGTGDAAAGEDGVGVVVRVQEQL